MTDDQRDRVNLLAMNAHAQAAEDCQREGLPHAHAWELATHQICAHYIGLVDLHRAGAPAVETGRVDGFKPVDETMH